MWNQTFSVFKPDFLSGLPLVSKVITNIIKTKNRFEKSQNLQGTQNAGNSRNLTSTKQECLPPYWEEKWVPSGPGQQGDSGIDKSFKRKHI